MTNPTDRTRYLPPDPERVERALGAMRARRARLRRNRAIAVSGALAVVVAVVAVTLSSNDGHRLRVAGTTSTTINASTTTAPTTSEATTSTSAAPIRQTRQIVYRPFTDSGEIDPGLRVTATVTGRCIAGASDRTFRCFATGQKGTIYDPCFAAQVPAYTFVCPTDPATPDVVKLTTPSPVTDAPGTAVRPWAFQLSNGWVCVFVSAAWGGLGPYDCQRNDSSIIPADCRQPTSSQPYWNAQCQDEKSDTSPFASHLVANVWF